MLDGRRERGGGGVVRRVRGGGGLGGEGDQGGVRAGVGKGVGGGGGQKAGIGVVVEDYDMMVTVMTFAWISILELTTAGGEGGGRGGGDRNQGRGWL